MAALKLAVVGCGKATESLHLPVMKASEQFEVSVLVDKALPRAKQLARQFDVPHVLDDYREIAGKADAAVLALPHNLHAQVAGELMGSGIHVLVEKPMALTTRECDEMIKVAQEHKRVLAVGLVRRFYRATAFVKQVLGSGLLGEVTSVDVREGIVFRWPVTSDFMFRKEAGGGVLSDTGPHTLDSLLYWFGAYESLEYFDDAMGGVEADCELYLTFRSGVKARVELSRTRDLRNSFIIQGERGSLEVGTGYDPVIRLKLGGLESTLDGHVTDDGQADTNIRDVFFRQLNDFAGAILDAREPRVPGTEGRRSVELIEACYASRQPLRYPWVFVNERQLA